MARPVGIQSDPLTRMQLEIDALQKQLNSLRRLSRPSIPTYSVAERAQFIFNQGEYYIVNDKLYFYSNGIERLVAST